MLAASHGAQEETPSSEGCTKHREALTFSTDYVLAAHPFASLANFDLAAITSV